MSKGDENSEATATPRETTGGLVRVRLTCTGKSPHLQNRLSEETLEGIRTKQKAAKTAPRKTPREECEPKVHSFQGKPVIPMPNIVACLIEAGRYLRLDGKRQMSTASSTMLPAFVEFEGDFTALVKRNGATVATWEPDMRQGRNPNGGEAVCVCRPRFDEWQFDLEITIDSTQISTDKIRELFDIAGARIGLGDFRPARKGTFGRFTVTRWEVKN